MTTATRRRVTRKLRQAERLMQNVTLLMEMLMPIDTQPLIDSLQAIVGNLHAPIVPPAAP